MSNLRGFQQKLKDDANGAYLGGARAVMMQLSTGGGKCLARGTLVMLHDGSVRAVETIMPDDYLMGPDSTPRRVLSICQGRERMYRVTPTKGESYIVNESHILSLRETMTGAIVNISILDYLSQTKTFKHCHKGWRTGVDFLEKTYPNALPPYMLGIWLGDGTSRNTHITTMDNEIMFYVFEHAYKCGLNVSIEEAGGRSVTLRPTTGKRGKGTYNPLRAALQQFDLLQNKHIPHVYLTGSKSQRLDLLAGLIDTDGYYDGKGGYTYSSKSSQLANDVVYLARSLGLAAYARKVAKRCQTGAIGEYHNVTISGNTSLIPCKLPRKQAHIRKQKKNVLNVGIAVEPLDIDDYFGFEIDGDRLFLLGDFTVTHNTVIMGSFAKDHIAQPWDRRFPAGCSIAHRGELLGQMSMQLAREQVPHGLIASEKVIRTIVAAHVEEFGRTFYNARSPWRVASVDTITRRELGAWPATVGMVHIDEAHHVLKENKWGKAAALFPNARYLLPTATPIRADRKGLGSHAHGIADVLIEGPPMRWLIDNGYLTDYKLLWITPDDLSTDGIGIGANGEFNQDQAREAVHRSKKLVGSIVDTYIKHARGKLGVTFAQDIEHAREICDEFNRKGIPAAVLTGEDSEEVRRSTIRKFRNRELWQLVNVDLFGEGFDLPAIECVSFGRLTASFALYSQMWGRALRLMVSQILAEAWDTYSVAQRLEFIRTSGKPFAFIFDHVGNFHFHKGPPDRPRVWTLDAGGKRGPSVNDGIPMRVCLAVTCAKPYERIYSACPYCGTEAPPPAERGGPAQVDGDLAEIDPQILAQYRGDMARIDGPAPNLSGPVHIPAIKQHMMRQAAQHRLREAMSYWYSMTTEPGDDNRVNWRRFWFTFNIDGMQAMTLGRPEAVALHERILADLTNRGIVVPVSITNKPEQV